MSKPARTTHLLLEGIARGLHLSAFANLCEDPDNGAFGALKAVLKGFRPGPGGNWTDTANEPPPAATEAAATVLLRCGPALIDWTTSEPRSPTDIQKIGSDVALEVLGTGAGLHDGQWDNPPCLPHLDEAYAYYVGDDGVVYAHTLVGDFDCWKLGERGLEPCPFARPFAPKQEGDLFD